MRPNSVSAGIAIALIGVGVGAVATVLLPRAGLFAIPIVVLAALLFIRRETQALAGGILVGFALVWSFGIKAAIERCAAFDRQPGGGCTIYGTDEQQLLAGLLAVMGVALATIAIAWARRSPGRRSA